MTIPEAHPEQPPTPPVDTLVVELTPRLRGYLRRFAVDPHEREDILQDVWMLYLLHRHRILDPDRTAAWLRTTASREAIRSCNGARRERPDQDSVEKNPTESECPAEQAALDCQLQAVRRAVAQLPERFRRLAGLMSTRPELTYAELAERLGVSPNSIGQLRKRCLGQLRRLLADEGITDAGL